MKRAVAESTRRMSRAVVGWVHTGIARIEEKFDRALLVILGRDSCDCGFVAPVRVEPVTAPRRRIRP